MPADRVRHRTTIKCFCPLNGDLDRYTVDVFPVGFLAAEAVVDATRPFQGGREATQERLTSALANVLGCTVRTRGRHCQGAVETVCVARPSI